MDTILKKPEIKRDAEGRFEQHGKGLIKKTQKNKMKAKKDGISHNPIDNIPPEKRQIGRPPGSLNKVTTNLREAILRALDKLGGDEYLVTLGIENSSAFAGLLGKVLPAVLAMDANSDGRPAVIRFERIIVMPDGSKHIEGKTPKQLPKPRPSTGEGWLADAPHVLPSDEPIAVEPSEIKDLDE